MKIGFARKFKSLDLEFLGYRELWIILQKVRPTASKPSGSGIYVDPFVPIGIGDWFYLSQDQSPGPTFIEVGDRKIVKWGADAGVLKNYTSDITDLPIEMFATEKEFGEAAKKAGDEADLRRKYDTKKETVYTRKAKRVTSVYSTAASKARELLWGHSSGEEDAVELANTVAGLLISEGGTERDGSKGAIFLATMMLFDLIEKNIRYGASGQTYTWASMLMHAGAKPEAQPAPDDIPGRGKAKEGKERKLAKHPMAGVGTVAFGKNICQNAANETRNRVVSITTAWLANYLAERDTGMDYRYFFIKSNDRGLTPKTKPTKDSYPHLVQMCLSALSIRAASTACLLNGSKTSVIGDVDEKGNVLKDSRD